MVYWKNPIRATLAESWGRKVPIQGRKPMIEELPGINQTTTGRYKWLCEIVALFVSMFRLRMLVAAALD